MNIKKLSKMIIHKKYNSGFSLVEMMVVVSIIGILSAIAVPNWISWRANAKVRSVSGQLFNDISSAKAKAINTGVKHGIDFQVTVGTTLFDYIVYTENDAISDGYDLVAVPPALSDVAVNTILFAGHYSGTTMLSGGGVPNQIVFNNRGLLDTGIQTIVVATPGGDPLNVVISALGRVSVQ